MFQECFNGVSSKFQWCFEELTRMFQESFMLHGTHRSFPSRGRACLLSMSRLFRKKITKIEHDFKISKFQNLGIF